MVIAVFFLDLYFFYSIHIINFLLVKEVDSIFKVMQGTAYDRPEIAQRVFKKREKSIWARGLEPAT